MLYRLCTYDLWGNEKDGFEVNDVFPMYVFDVPDRVMETDRKLIKFLKRELSLTGRYFRFWDVQGEAKHVLYFSYRGRPVFELRKVSE